MTRRVLTSLTILFLCALPLTREVRAEEHPAEQQPAESKDTGSDESKDADDASADHSDEATAGDSEHAADASDTHAEQGDAAPDDSEHAAGEDSKHPAADQPIPVDAAQLEDLDKGAKTEGAPESEKSETGAKAVVGEPASLSTDSGQQRSTSQSDGAPTQQSAASESGSPSLDDREDQTIYRVVVNHEEQYSIWPNYKENALGWKDAGKTGTKAECLAYIKEVWTDMRPLSLRQKMEGAANGNP